jgi:plasmid maintenance system antidote protein VapI
METNYNEIVVRNIRRKIDETGLKHTKIAENLGMTGNSFSGMLSGRKVIQARYIPIIAKTLGCSCDDIFRIPEENNKVEH